MQAGNGTVVQKLDLKVLMARLRKAHALKFCESSRGYKLCGLEIGWSFL